MHTTRPSDPAFLTEICGFNAIRVGPNPVMPRAHAHAEVEANLVVRGRITYLMGGSSYTVAAGRPVVFWAGIPHRIVSSEPDNVHIVVSVPIGWCLQWALPPSFTTRLLGGEFFESAPGDPTLDQLLFERWVRELAVDTAPGYSSAALEIQAWFLRFAHAVPVTPVRSRGAAAHESDTIERVTRYIGEHYDEDLSVPVLSGLIGVHPNSLSRLFLRQCGMHLWEYVTRVRVSHAQRLLLTTPMTALQIGAATGFGSSSSFYEAFHRYCGVPPNRYRAAAV